MEIISGDYSPVRKILKRFQKKGREGRLIQYCVCQQVEAGIILFNLLTRELVLLTEEEYTNPTALDYLWEHWFVIPDETNEKELVDFVRLVLGTRPKKAKHITDYIIYTTTDCNARCFYCFQHGVTRITMTQETAEKVTKYILSHCGGEKVRLQWFGGEPLLNPGVIDTVCTGLRQAGVAFDSYLVTNGYLLDEKMIRRAVERWNIHSVQISLDGTEQIYNRSKAYVNSTGSPYQVVMTNMDRLLEASVYLSVRLNLDLHNAEDLLDLVDDLGWHFGGKKKIHIYVHHLFNGNQSSAGLHSPEGWEKREQALICVADRIAHWGMESRQGIKKMLPVNACRANSDKAVVITPVGNIGLCDHFAESEFIGHIDRAEFDSEMVAAWNEKVPPIPECKDCVHYPDCILLKKCPEHKCFPALREERIRKIKRQMLNEYERWKSQQNIEETDEDELC